MRTIFQNTAKSTRRHRVVAALLGVVLALGAAAAVRAATSPDFAITGSPPNQTVNAGGSASYVISIAPYNGFGAGVTLTAGSLPKGGSASWTVGGTTTSTASVTLPAGSSTRTATLTIATAPQSLGTSSPTATATSGSLTHSTTLNLSVINQNSANFGLAVSPSAQTVAQGSISSTVAISRSNWTGSVSLSTTGLPTNATATFGSVSTTGNSSALSITTTSSTPAGTYTVNVIGNATLPAGNGNGNGNGVGSSPGGATTRYGAFTLTVLPPFVISGNLNSQLYLGSKNAQPLDVMITNPDSSPLTVSNINVVLAAVQQAAGAKGTCSQSGTNSPNFLITNLPSSYSVTVPANKTVALSDLGSGVEPTVTWIDQPGWAQNGCLHATLTFSYSGSGTL
jgi:hypothetical protein